MKNVPTIAAYVSSGKNSTIDAWRLGMMAVELWAAAVTTIMLRNRDWAANWPNTDQHSSAEGKRMIDEKISAAAEVNSAWLRAAFGIWSGPFDPWRSGRKILAPLHRKATANARRLTRRKHF